MEMILQEGFAEMSAEETLEVEAGGVVGLVSNFLANRLIWTNANVMAKKQREMNDGLFFTTGPMIA